jgi:hypothetical protein
VFQRVISFSKSVGFKVAGIGAIMGASVAHADVWTAATAEVTTASTNITTLLMGAVAIPLAFLGYRVIKKVVSGC